MLIMSNISQFAILIALFCIECVILKEISHLKENTVKDKDVLAIVFLNKILPYSDSQHIAKETSSSDDLSSDLDYWKPDYFKKADTIKLDDEESSEETIDDMEARISEDISNKNIGKGVLRNVWSSCSKKAAKYCKKACRRAYKNVCEEYKCKSSMKRSFKKESSCKSKFDAGYSSGYDE